MIDTAYNDGSEPTFGVERSYFNARNAWKFLGQEANICLNFRKGNHNPITDAQVKTESRLLGHGLWPGES